MTLATLTASQLLAEPEPLVDWLVDGVVPAMGVAVLAGDPKSFKTLMALQVACVVGRGRADAAFLERDTDGGPVLFVEEEGSRHKIRERVRMMSAGLGIDEPDVHFALHRSVRLDDPASLRSLAETVAELRPVLIVLDPLVMLHSGDENKASDMGRLMRGLVGIGAKFETLVLIVHHVNKPSAERKVTRAAQRLRGSSAFAGATDANLILDRTGDYTAKLRAELRDGEPVEITLELDPATLLLRAIDGPPARIPSKIAPDLLLGFVERTGMVTVRAVAEEFAVARNTARAALESTPGLDVFRDKTLGDRYFRAGQKAA